MESTLWIKIIRDLLYRKSRTLLLVLSITIGIIGVGTISQAKFVFIHGMNTGYSLSNPPQITLLTEGFDREMVQLVRNKPGVKTVEAKRTVYARIRPARGGESPADGDWNSLILFAKPDFTGDAMERIYPAAGQWPPPPNGLLLEASAMAYLQLQPGDQVQIDLGEDGVRDLPVVGVVNDPIRETASVSKRIYGYLSLQTLRDWGMPASYNSLAIQVDHDETNVRHLNDTAAQIQELLSGNGVHVLSVDIPEPGKHWAYDMVNSIAYILQVFGLLSLLLGIALIANTVSAMLIGQYRQIGIMKVVGATAGTIAAMYVGLIALICAPSLAAGVPLSLYLAELITSQSVRLLNFDRSGTGLSGPGILLQVVVGFVVPVAAAIVPILQAARMTEHEAIAGLRLSGAYNGASLTEALLMRVRILPRPLTLALRNTVRRKGRLLLTLFTLSVGGAIVISIISLRASIEHTIEQGLRYSNYDFRVEFAAQPKAELEKAALSVPGVTGVESWYADRANLIRPDKSMSQAWSLTAPPAGSRYLTPTLTKGRWLKSGGYEVVLNSLLLRQEPELRVGDSITLKIGDTQRDWHIVGFASAPKETDAFVDYVDVTRLLGRTGQATMLNVRTAGHDRSGQAETAGLLSSRLEKRGVAASTPRLTVDERSLQQSQYGIVVVFLGAMAVLLAVVAGLGLMGTMGLNVLERSREIGILRSIGASDRALWSIVVFEGVTIGWISWLMALVFSLPVSLWLCQKVGITLFGAPMKVVFSVPGAGLWLIAVCSLAAAASLAPAWKATRISVQEALKYE